MIEALFSQPEYIATKKMLDVNLMRHEAIASNLANVETPNYKRLDVSPTFEAQLQQAVGNNDTQGMMGAQPQLAVDTNAVATRGDGNTVELESELLKLNQNTLENAVETQCVTYNLARLRMAVTGKS